MRLMIVLLAAELVACCPKPKPPPPAPAPVVVTKPARCLEGLEPPPNRTFKRVTCSAPEAALCLAFGPAVELAAHLADLYRYRDAVERRCRPPADPKPENGEQP